MNLCPVICFHGRTATLLREHYCVGTIEVSIIFYEYVLLPSLCIVSRGQNNFGFDSESVLDEQHALESPQRTALSGKGVVDSFHRMAMINTSARKTPNLHRRVHCLPENLCKQEYSQYFHSCPPCNNGEKRVKRSSSASAMKGVGIWRIISFEFRS